MSQQDLILQVVNELLTTNSLSKQELPGVICHLLKPFAGKQKVNDQASSIINRMVNARGVCSRCMVGKLKVASDAYCALCKKTLKEKAKKVIH